MEKGYNQYEGKDCEDNYALLARLQDTRLLLEFSRHLDFKLYHMGVKWSCIACLWYLKGYGF